MTSTRTSDLRGSAVLGWIFIISVFGPMLVLTALWAIAAGVGAGSGEFGSTHDRIMDLMVWALLFSGVVLTAEAAFGVAARSLRGSRG